VKKSIGAFAAAMGGLEAVAFTGGIGENSARLRRDCCQGLEFLGVRLDRARNETGSGDRVVSAEDSRVTVLALATNEELIVARRAFRKLSAISTPHTPTALCMEPLTAPRPRVKNKGTGPQSVESSQLEHT
jgi:hypothetical protein